MTIGRPLAAPAPSPDKELRRAARGSLLTLVGAGSSALLGFAFNIVLARLLGPLGAGVVLQSVATFLIALSVARCGLDTTAVWLLPRLVDAERHRVRAALVGLLVPAFLIPLAVTGAWLVVREILVAHRGSSSTYDALGLVAFFLPAASVMTVALAATRAFGGVLPFNAIGNVLVPGLRPVFVALVVAVGGSPVMVAVGWAVPWVVGAVIALAVLVTQARRATPGAEGGWRPDAELRGRIRRYALPRVVASGLDQSIIWLDVVLVGVLIGAAAAGIYGTVGRFVMAGMLVATALRIVVAPRFSAMLGQGRIGDVERLYVATARWILLLGAPAYVLLALFAPTVLGWLGGGFGEGRVPLVLLCAGSVVVLAAGNVQALLLMSGRSGVAAVNKAIVLACYVTADLLLVPWGGITAAAAVWAASMTLDTALAAWQVRRHVGVSVAAGSIGAALLAVTLTVGVPSVAVVLLLGQGTSQLLLAVVLSGASLLGYAYLDRSRLQLDQLGLRRGTGR